MFNVFRILILCCVLFLSVAANYLPVVRVAPSNQLFCIVPFLKRKISGVQTYQFQASWFVRRPYVESRDIVLEHVDAATLDLIATEINSQYKTCSIFRPHIFAGVNPKVSVDLVFALMPITNFLSAGGAPAVQSVTDYTTSSICLLSGESSWNALFALRIKPTPEDPVANCFNFFTNKRFINNINARTESGKSLELTNFVQPCQIRNLTPHVTSMFSLCSGPKNLFETSDLSSYDDSVRVGLKRGRRELVASLAPARINDSEAAACLVCGIEKSDLRKNLNIKACLNPECGGFVCASPAAKKSSFRCKCGNDDFKIVKIATHDGKESGCCDTEISLEVDDYDDRLGVLSFLCAELDSRLKKFQAKTTVSLRRLNKVNEAKENLQNFLSGYPDILPYDSASARELLSSVDAVLRGDPQDIVSAPIARVVDCIGIVRHKAKKTYASAAASAAQ